MLMTGICGTTILVGSTETLPFNPGDGTDESLVKRESYNVWTDDWTTED